MTAAPAAGGHYRVIALIVGCAMLMEQIDATVLATALPAIARDFREPVNNLSILLTAYLLALAVFIPVSGRAADRFGARNVLRAAMLIFMGASLLCALSQNITQMVIARFIQGSGGAMMLPVGRLALLRAAPRDKIVAATSWLVTPALIGTMLGPPLGGVIVTHLDWRWIFYINLPICAGGVLAVSRFIDNSRVPPTGRPDLRGFAISAVGLGCLLLGCEKASRAGEGGQAVALLSVAVLMGLIYVAYARRRDDPFLDLTVLRDRSFRLSLAGGSLGRICQGAHPFLLPLMFQVGFGFAPAASGAIVLAPALGAFISKLAVGTILRKFGYRRSFIVNGLLSALFYGLPSTFSPHWPVWAMILILMLAGFFTSIQFTAYNTIAYESIAPEKMSRASSFYFTFQQLLLSLGICTAALTIHVSMIARGHATPVTVDFTTGFLVVATVSFLALFVNLRFAPHAGAALSGHTPQAEEIAID